MPSAHLPSPFQVQLSFQQEGEHPPSLQLTTLSLPPTLWQACGAAGRKEMAQLVVVRTCSRSYGRARLSLTFLLGLWGPHPAPALNENASNSQRLGKKQRTLSLDPE